VVASEIRERLNPSGLVVHADAVDIPWTVGDVESVRTATAVSRVLDFPVPRPKALLGDENLRRLHDAVGTVVARHDFHGVRIAAAGADSAVMQRIAADVGAGVDLPVDQEDGDLVLRIAPGERGWRVAIRLTPRPLATRSWRVADYHGAVNAAIAAAAVRLTVSHGNGLVVNPMCGSATLAIECALAFPRATIVAADTSAEALSAARANVRAAKVEDQIDLRHTDATALELGDASASAVLCDPPWSGMSADEVRHLYDGMLREILRVLTPGGRFAWLSHQLDASTKLLDGRHNLRTVQRLKLRQGGLHPTLWVMQLSM
jgi:23S rRNA G2445 N2-methylase RlmL